MTQEEKRKYLIRELLSEQPQDKNIEIPGDTKEQKRLLRSLMNIREPRAIGEEFLKVQDEYLSAEVEEKGITDSDALPASSLNLSISHAVMSCIQSDRLCMDSLRNSIAGSLRTAIGHVWSLQPVMG